MFFVKFYRVDCKDNIYFEDSIDKSVLLTVVKSVISLLDCYGYSIMDDCGSFYQLRDIMSQEEYINFTKKYSKIPPLTHTEKTFIVTNKSLYKKITESVND